MNALADVETWPSWFTVHRFAEVLDTHVDGRPHHVRVVVKVMGLADEEVLEYHWGPDWVVWDVAEASKTRAQHGEYRLEPERESTRVRFDITFESAGFLGGLLNNRARKLLLKSGTEGLRKRVLSPPQPII